MRYTLLPLLALMAIPSRASATPCGRLNDAQKEITREVMDATYPYACCDETLTTCLK